MMIAIGFIGSYSVPDPTWFGEEMGRDNECYVTVSIPRAQAEGVDVG